MYVQKFSNSKQGFIKIPKTVPELLKKYFLGGDVQQHKKLRKIIKFMEI